MTRNAVWRGLVVLVALALAACRGEPTGPSEPGPLPGGISFANVASNTFTQVAAGQQHSCALRSDGVVECWGWNDFGQAPATRAALSGSFTQVTAGGNHTCALRTDGVVECWGYNTSGQAPATRGALSGSFTQVTAGGVHTCALRNDGVREWGG
jgi:alpha-tubulin suppressor-like RCC1 family protein